MAGIEAFRIYGTISADTGPFDKNLSSAQQRAQKFATTLNSVGNKLTVGLTLPLVGFATKAVSAFEESAKAAALTEAAIKSTGGAANVTADEIANLSEALSKQTAIDDELIQSSANLLLSFTNVRNEVGKGNDVFNQAMEAALDLSARGFGSVESASVMLGKALNDPIRGLTALSRAGVQFTDSQKAMITAMVESGDVLGAQKLILEEIAVQVGGSAEAAKTSSAAMAVAFDNLAESVGTILAPVLEKIADTVTDVVESFQALPKDVQETIVKVAAFAALAGPVLKLASVFIKLGAAIRGAAVAAGLLKATGVAGAGSGGGAAAGAGGVAAVGIVAAVAGSVAAFKNLNDQIDEGVSQLEDFGGRLEDATVETDGFFQDFFGAFNPFFKLADSLGIVDAGIEAQAREQYLEQMQRIIEQLGFVNPALRDFAAELTKTYSMTEEEAGKLSGLMRALEQFGGTIDKSREQQLKNVLAMGDTRRAFQLLKSWIDQVRDGLRGLSAAIQAASSSAAGQRAGGGGQMRVPPEFAGGNGVPGRRRRRRRNNTAAGGLVTGPQIRMVGEAGPEAIIPLSKLEVMLKRDKASVQSVQAADANREVRAFGKLLAESTEATKRNIEALEDAEYQVEFFGAALAEVSGEQEKVVGGIKAWLASLDEREARIYRRQLNDEMREMIRYYREFFMGGMTNPGLSPYNTAGISQLNMNRLRSDDGSMAAAINRLERTVAASSSQPIVVRIDRKAFQRDVDYLERSRNL